MRKPRPRNMICFQPVPRTNEDLSIPSNESGFYKLDPERYAKNGVDKLSEPSINIYTGKPIVVERHVREIYGKSVNETLAEGGREDCRWTLEEIRTFFEKVFVYKRDFGRIAQFIPMKTYKDVTNFFFATKKLVELKKHEVALRECVTSKLAMIHRTAASILDIHFNSLENTRLPLVQSSAFDSNFQGFSLRTIMLHL